MKGKTGWFRESRRHSLAAKGVKTVVIFGGPSGEEKLANVKKVATKEQMIVINDMQEGTEFLFLFLMNRRGPITEKSIDDTLRIMVNSVEGDVSQLEDEHAKYAEEKGWL